MATMSSKLDFQCKVDNKAQWECLYQYIVPLVFELRLCLACPLISIRPKATKRIVRLVLGNGGDGYKLPISSQIRVRNRDDCHLRPHGQNESLTDQGSLVDQRRGLHVSVAVPNGFSTFPIELFLAYQNQGIFSPVLHNDHRCVHPDHVATNQVPGNVFISP